MLKPEDKIFKNFIMIMDGKLILQLKGMTGKIQKI